MTAQDILGSLVVKKFFCESTVGLKMVSHAETVIEGRKSEKIREEEVLAGETASQKLVDSNSFLGDDDYELDAFNTKGLQDLDASSCDALEV